MVIDINGNEVKMGEVFHFKNSLAPFIFIQWDLNHIYFLNLNTYEVFDEDELNWNGYEFGYEEGLIKGVTVDGHIEWVE